MKINYILLFINNDLAKLIKYQDILYYSPTYADIIAINLIFY